MRKKGNVFLAAREVRTGCAATQRCRHRRGVGTRHFQSCVEKSPKQQHPGQPEGSSGFRATHSFLVGLSSARVPLVREASGGHRH